MASRRGAYSDSSLLQLLEDSPDRDGEGERQLAASLLGVRGREDSDVGFVRLGRVLCVELLHQVLQVPSQEYRLPPQRLHARHVKHLEHFIGDFKKN